MSILRILGTTLGAATAFAVVVTTGACSSSDGEDPGANLSSTPDGSAPSSTNPGPKGPASDASSDPIPDSGQPCAVHAADHRLYCANRAEAPILGLPKVGNAQVDALKTTYSWFDCWIQGDPNPKGNTTWYHTIGDHNGAAGYVASANVSTTAAYDTGPKTGLAKCETGTAAELAAQLLALWGGRLTGNSVVKQDLTTTSTGGTINNSDTCGKTITLDPRLLAALLRLTDTYDLFVDNIVTGHGCDQFYHPKGMASDLGGATDRATGMSTNFTPGTARDNEAFDRAFVEYFSTILPNNAGLGQAECAGRTTAKIAAGVHYFDDTCTHQHVQMSY